MSNDMLKFYFSCHTYYIYATYCHINICMYYEVWNLDNYIFIILLSLPFSPRPTYSLSLTFSSLAPTSLLFRNFCSVSTLYPFTLVNVHLSHSTCHLTAKQEDVLGCGGHVLLACALVPIDTDCGGATDTTHIWEQPDGRPRERLTNRLENQLSD